MVQTRSQTKQLFSQGNTVVVNRWHTKQKKWVRLFNEEILVKGERDFISLNHTVQFPKDIIPSTHEMDPRYGISMASVNGKTEMISFRFKYRSLRN